MGSARVVVVVGAGPAGLAAAVACREQDVCVRVLEQGLPHTNRRHDDPDHAATGVGGAGLFSDGKFSFYPSATNVWCLEPREDLERAYAWLTAQLHVAGLAVPPLPRERRPRLFASGDRFALKAYPSISVSLARRINLIEDLAQAIGPGLETGTQVVRMNARSDRVSTLILRDGEQDVVEGDAAVVATGRLGAAALSADLPACLTMFGRLEIGVRIEQPADKFFLRDVPLTDPKFILTDGERQYRTFCVCRAGEIVPIRCGGLLTLSGRSDGGRTQRSNAGFLLRITDADLAGELWADMLPRLVRLARPIAEPLEEFLTARDSAIAALFGARAAEGLRDGIQHLIRQFGAAALDEATLHAPALEGVLRYPKVDRSLRVGTLPLWVAGDACGRFRGLVAALLSGYVAGSRAAARVTTCRR